ncbi:MAG TPA: 30S ribosomal protein S18 [Actinobacteria bacterium]|nr:30S ribosomal protein S18 [Actinomycetota bacterium]
MAVNVRKKEGGDRYFKRFSKRICFFCKGKIDNIDYKDLDLLRKSMNDKGKIKPRRVTGTCTQHQRKLATAIKRAREMALIKYPTK